MVAVMCANMFRSIDYSAEGGMAEQSGPTSSRDGLRRGRAVGVEFVGHDYEVLVSFVFG